MSKRTNFIGISAIVLSFFVLVFYATKSSSYYDESDKRDNVNLLRRYNKKKNYTYASTQQQQVTQNLMGTIEEMINHQRQMIAREMQDYDFPNGKFGVDAKNLQELTPETGGVPIRSIIISTWRSGTTFAGDVLNAIPGTYYHYEPLQYFGVVQIRGPPNDKNAVRHLKKMMNCDYSGLDEYLEFRRKKSFLFSQNFRMWNHCHFFPYLCFDSKFVDTMCKLFPMQSMKLVRLRMHVAAELLRDPSLNVRIVLLMRDPRGSLQSRKHLKWCPGKPDLCNPNICEDMVSDYKAAVALVKEFPTTFKVVRYEDLSLSPFDGTQELLQFYGLSFDERVSDYLETHTKVNEGNVFSTSRDSKSTPFHWTQELPYPEVKDIQDSCKEAMQFWGYQQANNESELKNNFNPLLSFPEFE